MQWMDAYTLNGMAKPTKLFSICSLLMSCMFAYSSFVQVNDPDWYFWFPLYACACVINLLNPTVSSKTTVAYAAKVALCLGIALFIKVVVEDLVTGKTGFFSLDLTERLVREKIGSGIVVISIILHRKASSVPTDLKQRKRKEIARFVDFGMAVLVGFSYGLPFSFFVLRKADMKF